MKQYQVSGMSCAACSSHVEKAVSKVPGVSSCSVNLLTNSMIVDGTASSEEIVKAVVNAGYGASVKDKEGVQSLDTKSSLNDTETPKILKRLIVSLCLLMPLMYVSMGHTMWGWPLPSVLRDNMVAVGLIELLLSIAVLIVNQKFFINGWKGIVNKAPNMDTLVSLGSAAAFCYSVFSLFAMSNAQNLGNTEIAMRYLHEFYFESAAMILTLITLGKLLETRSKGKTTNAIKGLMDLSPKTAVIMREGSEMEVPIEQVKIGDIFIVKPGSSIPVDGIIKDGHGAVNESALTGESIPIDKVPGDNISAATINQSGYFRCEATRVGDDTTLSQIIRMVSDASSTKAPIAKIADRVSGIFVPIVIVIALVTFAIWMIAGQTFGYSLARAISVLVISCPCALGLATPVAIMVGSGMGAKNGIMFKTATALEETGKVQIVALDKTGTITKGEPAVTDITTAKNITEDELLKLASALERKSEHPLAKAILKYAQNIGIEILDVENFETLAGNGIKGTFNGCIVAGGNLRFIEQQAKVDTAVLAQAEFFAQQGKTPIFFSNNGIFVGCIAVADTIKEDSCEAIRELKDMGIRVVMLTGDNIKTAETIGMQADVDDVIAEVLPNGKEEIIRRLKNSGKVIMVGDGINDAPALTVADIGMAIGAGTDIAIDAADVVLMKSSLLDVPATIRMSRATLLNIHENLFWAFFYNVIGIPLAAGLWIPIFGWTLNPMFGAAAMSLSSFCVVMNALRLNFVKPYNKNRYSHRIQLSINKTKRSNNMITLNVEGMMCSHCENHVKTALEKLTNVESATADAKTGIVSIKVIGEVTDSQLKETIENAGYNVTKIVR